MGSSSPSIGDAVGDALYDWTDIGKGWEELKKNPEEFAEYVLSYLEQTGSAPINRDATKKVIVQAVQKSAKVLDKMIPTVESLKHLKATSHAVSGAADDPFQILRNAGIDIEPELEEFRQFLAEISGKKIEPERGRRTTEIPKPSEELMKAKLEVLSILNGLEFTGFSEEAKQKAIEKLSSRIEEVSAEKLTPENLQRLGLYAFAIEIIKSGNFERLREIERL